MKQHRETEIKLLVRDPGELKQRLAELGLRRIKARQFESNYVYDFPDRRLRRARCLLRLRFAGDKGLLTFKGVPLRSREYKIRREIEIPVGDGHGLREILKKLGLREMFYYEKYRTIYAPRGKWEGSEVPQLVYDETPVGNYLELEGPEHWIDEIARQLGYSREEFITESYAALYWQKCLEQGKKPTNMVFSARKS